MAKSPDAFRTISEVADWLDTPAHVLRFWESKFSQVKPVKRAGGRRYYRPADMALLAGLKKLLHEDGLTIKGAQKVLREKGVKHVAALGGVAIEDADAGEFEGDIEVELIEVAEPEGKVLPFTPPAPAAAPAPQPEPEPLAAKAAPTPADEPEVAPEAEPAPAAAHEVTPEPEAEPAPAAVPEVTPEPEAADLEMATALPGDMDVPERSEELPEALEPAQLEAPDADEDHEQMAETAAALPDFITGWDEPEAPQPLGADIPDDPDDEGLVLSPGPLAHLARLRRLTPAVAERLVPYLDDLRRRGENPRHGS